MKGPQTGTELMRAVKKVSGHYKAAAAECSVCLTCPFQKSNTKAFFKRAVCAGDRKFGRCKIITLQPFLCIQIVHTKSTGKMLVHSVKLFFSVNILSISSDY